MDNPLKVSLENIIPLTEARDHFSQIVNEVQKDKLYVLTKGGKPAVAIIDVKYLEHITGGETKMERIEEEIKKAPEKVGLPPMVEHQQETPKPTPLPSQPLTPPSPPPPPITPPPPKPFTPSPKIEPPKPAGFAAPSFAPPTGGATEDKPQPPTPPLPPPPPARNASASVAGGPLKTPELPKNPPNIGEKIDIQISKEPPPEDKTRAANNFRSPDDKNPPGQYAGSSQEEPEDMSID